MDDSLFLIIMVLFGLIFLAFVIYSVALRIQEFTHELRLIKTEIRRTSGRERRYWKKRKRRLWLSWIPFVPYH